MKIFTASQLYEADKITIQKQGISSEQLMERAAVEIFNWLHRKMQGAQVKIQLFCGIGNNGGDGLALARHLWEHGYNIEVHVVSYSDKRSDDFLANLNKLKARKIWPNFIQEESSFPQINPEEIIIDAIFGIGLNREPEHWVRDLISHLNQSKAFIVSVDVPSGLYLDQALDNPDAVIRSNYVLSIQAPKLVFFLPQTGIYCEQWEVLDIGMDREFIENTEASYELIGREEVLQWYRPRERFSHKGTYGHSLIIGGSYGKIGAVVLSSKACLSAGSGLVTAYVPKCGYEPLQTAATEIMVLTDKNEEFIEDIQFDLNPTVIALGMGMGVEADTVKTLRSFLKNCQCPIVIDADGLNMLSNDKSLLKLLPTNTVLTPHPGELRRLIGEWKDDFEKLEKAKEFAALYNCILVLKDAYTIVIHKGKAFVNSTGNPGMATAGSGDVLTGMISGLIARGYEAVTAAIMGVYLHGSAGDIAAEQLGYEAMTAGAIIESIGNAYLELIRPPSGDDESDNKNSSQD